MTIKLSIVQQATWCEVCWDSRNVSTFLFKTDYYCCIVIIQLPGSLFSPLPAAHGLQLHKILLNPIILLNQIFGPKPSSRNVIGRCMSILIYRSQVWKDYQIFLKWVKPYKLTPTKTFPEDGLGPKNWFKRKIGFKRILCSLKAVCSGQWWK